MRIIFYACENLKAILVMHTFITPFLLAEAYREMGGGEGLFRGRMKSEIDDRIK